ncbi:PTS system, cellobiose-specific IIB component [Pilibacter termitis]|uniref:PTS system, cellobiose-specific IIB component n=1 Tax=Pilibacter termitis TaxID=263852 RepID=A0A1T4Q446_9ENTE|nr:PTS sugar transporter subunit IIB [Pilibacter termitis]SJZ98434.1 PTS system, cellobiose-specific IIB component [Pilibacter termitis]
MKKTQIRLFCSAGMSTTLLVKKMQKEADSKDANVEIEAFPVSEISSHAKDADVILLGPQIRYLEGKVKEEFPEKKIEVIAMRDYGMMDGKKVFENAMELLK